MKKVMILAIAASLLSACHFLNERQHENVMKIPQNMYNLDKEDKKLAKSDQELRKKTEHLEKRQAKLERKTKKIEVLGKDVKQMKETVQELKGSMQQQIEEQQVEIQQLSEHAVKLTLQDKLMFNKRSVQIKRKGRHLLNDFAKAVQDAGSPVHIRIVGHTDDLPISKFQRTEFLDNWELSADRAAAVARYLIWAGKLDGSMMHVEGRADTQPIVPNTSEKNRAQNRRVELYIENSVGEEPLLGKTSASANPCDLNTAPTKEPEVTPVM